MADKTIRWQVDSSNVVSEAARVRREVVDTNKENENSGRKIIEVNKEDIKDVEAKLNLVRQINKEEEEAGANRIRLRQEEIRLAEEDLRLWRLRRTEESTGKTGREKLEFNNDTKEEENRRRQNLSEEKVDLITERQEFRDLKESNKNQEKELEEIKNELTKGGSGGGTRMLGNGISMFNNAGAGNTGGVAGNALEMVIGAAKVGGAGVTAGAAAIAAGVMAARSYESGLTSYLIASQGKKGDAVAEMWDADRVRPFGVSKQEYMTSQSNLIRSHGGKFEDNSYGLMAAGVSRGISDEQLQMMMKISRYSGGQGVESISMFEKYLKDSGKSLVQLPEILGAYLHTANSILERTGRVDKEGVQTMMTSIGKSFGLEGRMLDRMYTGVVGMSGKSSNPILQSVQMETLRGMYPNMDTWEMSKVLEDPTKDPEFIKKYMNNLMNIGGRGSMYSKFAVKSEAQKFGLGGYDVDEMVDKPLSVEKPKKMSKADIADANKGYEGAADNIVFNNKAIETGLKNIWTDTGLILSTLMGLLTNSDTTANEASKSTKHLEGIKKAAEENNRRK